MSEVFTFADVATHSSKKDLYIVVHEKVYNASSFIDEHPGGEEVLLDVGGQDATEAFEDVGHSDEAREILDGLIVGSLKRVEGDPPARHTGGTDKVSAGPGKGSGGETGFGIALYAVLLVGGLLAFGAYQYLQSAEKK